MQQTNQEEKINHPPPSDRAHAAFRRPACPELCRGELVEGAVPPSPEFWILPKNAKRTLKKNARQGVPPLYLTPPEVGDPAHDQNTRNEPNSRTPGVQPPPISAKRTLKANARHRRASTYLTPVFQPGSSHNQKERNEPNPGTHSVPPPNYAKRTQSQPRRTCGGPKKPKRTQSQPGQPPKCAKRNKPNKDNARCNRAAPIFNPHGSGGYAHDPKIRNEPNLPPQPPCPTPKNAKRTQFTTLPPTSAFTESSPFAWAD